MAFHFPVLAVATAALFVVTSPASGQQPSAADNVPGNARYPVFAPVTSSAYVPVCTIRRVGQWHVRAPWRRSRTIQSYCVALRTCVVYFLITSVLHTRSHPAKLPACGSHAAVTAHARCTRWWGQLQVSLWAQRPDCFQPRRAIPCHMRTTVSLWRWRASWAPSPAAWSAWRSRPEPDGFT